MIFLFLKYLQPTYYFLLPRKSGNYVFPKISSLPKELIEKLKPDQNYKDSLAIEYDLSWRVVQGGFVLNHEVEAYERVDPLPLVDNYRFIRKYFHVLWVYYVLIIRLLSFVNPIKEFKTFFSTLGITRQSYRKCFFDYKSCPNSFSLIDMKPLVSVVIPTLNRYSYLKDVLDDLEKQDYDQFEVLVVDQSEPFDNAFYNQFKLTLKVIRQEEKALWLARNTAIKHAKGALIALSEDDVRIEPDWLSNHLKCISYFKADVSAGVFYPLGGSIPPEKAYFQVASQFATGNALLYRKVFEKVGLFDRQFEKQRMGDGEFGLRLYLEGLLCVSNPYASCIDVKAPKGGLREMGSWDAFRTQGWTSPRPIPSVLYLFRKYFGDTQARYALLKNIPPSVIPYRFKGNKVLLILGVVLSVVILPWILWQVHKSWRVSTQKLKEGPLIEVLK